MSTLLAVTNADGHVGRCNARCYNARMPHCECGCDGVNHGVGLTRAIMNTRALIDQGVIEHARYEVGAAVAQETLFT